MSVSHNRVTLIGNTTRDIELKYLASGTAVCDVTLAVNDRRKDNAGNWVDETTFVDVTFFGRTAEVASEYAHKGSSILVEGRLKQDSWEDKSTGQRRSKLKVVADLMKLLGGRKATGGSAATRKSDDYEPQPQGGGDDVPF